VFFAQLLLLLLWITRHVLAYLLFSGVWNYNFKNVHVTSGLSGFMSLV